MPPYVNERSVEIPWLLQRLDAQRPKTLLDVGHAGAAYAPDLLARVPFGGEVVFQDVRPFQPIGVIEGYSTFVGKHWPKRWCGTDFNAIICISVLDHVGLDAYGNTADPDALPYLVDQLALCLESSDGVLYLTVPVGRDILTTHPGGGQRVFSRESLLAIFPDHEWAVEGVFFRLNLATGVYENVRGWADVADAGYLADRAEAVACLELRHA